jgi:hypothetical protein
MINAKVKILSGGFSNELEEKVNKFLEKIDIRQIIKIEFSANGESNSRTIYCSIIYVGIDDIIDAKIDNILEIK